SRRRHTRFSRDWSSDVCSSDLGDIARFLLRIRHERPTSQVLIEHDVRFVRDICTYLYVLDFGTVIAEGTPDEVLRDEAVIAAYRSEERRVGKEGRTRWARDQ